MLKVDFQLKFIFIAKISNGEIMLNFKEYEARISEPLHLPKVTVKLKVNWLITSRND